MGLKNILRQTQHVRLASNCVREMVPSSRVCFTCLSLTAFVDVLALELTELEVCVDFGEVRVDEELLVAGASGVMHAFSPLLNTNFTLCGFVETVRRSPLERFFAPLFETGEPFTNTFALLEKAGLTEN